MDASRPWIIYWCLHGVDLLDKLPNDHDRCRMVATLEHCWSSFGLTEHPVSEDEDPLYYSEGTNALIAGQNLETNFRQKQDSRTFRISLTYNFGNLKLEKENTDIQVEKKQAGGGLVK